MNRPALLPGVILIGLGVYFFLRELDLPQLAAYLSWPVILIIIGAAFLITSFSSQKQKMLVLPGSILTLLGIHFWGMHFSPEWPTHWSFFPGIVGLAFLLTFLRTRETSQLVPATILLAVFVLAYLFNDLSLILDWWPVALIIVGVFLLVRRN